MPPICHRISNEEQLKQWLAGNSLHRHVESKYVKDGECCPDFSCCQPELLATPEERQAYVIGDRSTRTKWLSVFLGRAIQRASKAKELRVRICTGEDPGKDN